MNTASFVQDINTAERIASLRRQYQIIHEHVLDAYRHAANPDLSHLQRREHEIVLALKKLGAEPYA